MSVSAAYYDGQSSQRREVRLYATGATLTLEGADVQRVARPGEYTVSERLGRAPRQIRFADGAFCEAPESPELRALLEAAGHRPSTVEHWQVSPRIAIVSAIAVVAALVLGYLYGLPWLADRAAEHVPRWVDKTLSERTVQALDRGLVDKSGLTDARRAAIVEAFGKLKRPPGEAVAIDIRFGTSKIGPNAFALPDGTVILLDELVELCDHDEQILAVLGHELGHVRHRHGLRMLLQGSLAGILAAWWLGDVTGVFAAAPAALLQARYSRGFESEADAYAVALLRTNGIAPARLAEALEKLHAAHGRHAGDEDWVDYLSSHPAPRARIEALRAQ